MATEAEVLTGELVALPESRTTLFQTNDPVEVLAAAREVATAWKGALDEGMIVKIGRSEHVTIEGWQTVGAMLGISPHTVWSKPLPAGHGWEARAEARTVDGHVVGSAEAMVTREERNWTKGEEFAVRSMAQTRAMSKAMSAPLRFIVTLAGKSGTPAEEVTPEAAAAASGAVPWPHWAQPVPDVGKAARLLTGILVWGGVEDAADRVNQIGQTLMDTCNGTIPVAVEVALEQITEALDAGTTRAPAPPAPEPDAPPASE